MSKLNEYLEMPSAKKMSHETVLRVIEDISYEVADFASDAIDDRAMMFAGRSAADKQDIMERIVEEIQRAVAEKLIG